MDSMQISVPDAPPTDYGVYHFRRSFELAARPETFVVHVYLGDAEGDARPHDGERQSGLETEAEDLRGNQASTRSALDYAENNIVPGQEGNVRGYWNTDPCAGGYPAFHYGGANRIGRRETTRRRRRGGRRLGPRAGKGHKGRLPTADKSVGK